MLDTTQQSADVGKAVTEATPSGVSSPAAANSPEALLAIAVQNNVSIDTLERLMVLRDKVNSENARNAYVAAMAQFQSECPTIEKTKTAKDGKGVTLYKYAPLEKIVEVVAPLLKRHGFSYTFKTNQSVKDEIEVICIVTHQLGHSETSTLTVASTGGTSIMSGPQKVAAALTFAKRYTFISAFGIVTGDEDVDGKKEEGTKPDAPSEDQKNRIDELLSQLNMPKADFAKIVREKYGISITSITARQAEGIITGLEKKLGVNQ